VLESDQILIHAVKTRRLNYQNESAVAGDSGRLEMRMQVKTAGLPLQSSKQREKNLEESVG
jgi:hypothetical protein